MIHFFIKEYFQKDEATRKILFAVIAKMLIWFSAIISTFCFFGILIYVKFIAKDFSLPVSPYLAMAVFCIPLTGLFNLVQARYRMERNSKSFFNLTVANGVLGVGLSLLFVVIIKWGAFGKLLAPLLANIGVFLFVLIRYKNHILIETPKKEYLTILKFCWPLALSAMLGYFTNGFDKTYLESIGDTNRYGFYIVGASIATYLNSFSTAIYNTFQPDLYENVIKKDWKKYARFISMIVGLVSLCVGAFIILAPYVIGVLTAFRYVDSTPFARIISLSIITSTIYFIINDYTITINRPKIYLYTSIFGSIFIACLMPVMVNHFKFYGGAWMTVLSFIGMAVINIILIQFSNIIRRNKSAIR